MTIITMAGRNGSRRAELPSHLAHGAAAVTFMEASDGWVVVVAYGGGINGVKSVKAKRTYGPRPIAQIEQETMDAIRSAGQCAEKIENVWAVMSAGT